MRDMRMREKEREFGRRREEATIGGGGCDEPALPIWACFKERPPLVGINAVFMQTYIGKVSCPYICGKQLDHGVLLVGYGSASYATIRFKEAPFWILKNSWGENWGENGYYKICRGCNVCGVGFCS